MLENGVYFMPGYYEFNAFKVQGDNIMPIASIDDPAELFWDYENDKPVTKSWFNSIIDDLINYFKTEYQKDCEEKCELYIPTRKEWAQIKRQMKEQLSVYIR